MQPKITVYAKSNCPYCNRAKSLLEMKNLQYDLIDVTNNQILFEEMLGKSQGRKTVPQIFIDDMAIGGFDDLEEMNTSGKLDLLLES